ncbi:hypothetical protein EXIGLDRAFT_747120 [Exidia glandulosa HHB12029]|uniref:Acyltransferase 3 domain-containing protein n=1 Tax=Exidia glandulosa HHB12029 TaxID=1314781 RepID=A0A165L4N3_EXIGL|nr:hypothetical protein EXIGLDRAFT_747120 [Exidia glandulosa HHB12029]
MWYLLGIHPAIRGPPARSLAHGQQRRVASGRQEHLDTLRTFLTGLVIFHHTAIIYGGEGGWYYVETTRKNALLSAFTGTNQSFFMGAFFVVSGYLSAQSLKRSLSRANRLGEHTRSRACWTFFKGKLLRLGLPTLVYTLFGHALTLAAARGQPFTLDFYKAYLTDWLANPGVRGPPWYCALALIFDGLFAAHSSLELPSLPVYRYTPPLMLALLPVVSFFWRRVSPLGWNFTPLGLHSAFLPQYIIAYATGIFLSGHSHLVFPDKASQTPRTKWWTSPLPAVGLYAAFTAFLLTYGPTRAVLRDPTPLFGLNYVAFLYCVWNEIGFVALTHSVMRIAHLWTDPTPRGGRVLPRLAYGAFLVHSTVCTFIPSAMREIQLPPVTKTVVVGSLCTALSFCLSALLVRIPGVRNVI